jgi:hypothetical protein
MINEEPLSALEAATPKTLALWYCELNSWRWPAELGNAEPVPTKKEDRSPRREEIMRWIEYRVSARYLNRVWNRNDMSDEQHEAWWKNNEELYRNTHLA